MAAVHVSPFGGSWYPGHRAELEQLLDELFERSRQRTGPCLLPQPVGLVVPHAGLVYSGAVAAAAYRCLRALKPQRVIVLGFSHRGGPAGISIPDVERIVTPLGEVEVDRSAAERLAACGPFQMVEEDRVCDHSVEIQLPFLQKAAPGVPVILLYVGQLSHEERESAAQALSAWVGPGTVLVASSDFTHYGRDFGYQPFPADERISESLRDLDFSVMHASGSLDSRFFFERLVESGATVCGHSPIGLLLETLRFAGGEEIYQEILDYQTSGEITGDFHHSVSYGGLGYFRADSFKLDEEDQRSLLDSAHETLRYLRATGERKAIRPTSPSPALTRRTGVFVSLHQGDRLLGCVGQRSATRQLARAVPELTLAAALEDPRFPPILGVEGEIDIEISVLSPMKRIRDGSGFCVRRHGACVESGLHQAVLLPQVASARNWNAQAFLEALARKAGLAPEAYGQPGADLYVFQAQVFSAKKLLANS